MDGGHSYITKEGGDLNMQLIKFCNILQTKYAKNSSLTLSSRQVGWQIGRMVDMQDGRQVGWQIGRMVDRQDGIYVGWQIGRMVDSQDGSQVGKDNQVFF